ncbi:HAMP domain-containing protein [Tepidamorphus gemmatus]|uniref:histidine kinase n=1 Tax=Tepidamorphus gemmatus TaxID=747076 RepID=A0A4R3MBU9_9HYPH|nr:HAMP domain-containing sensor histidine kinase [Tepidamorphus gemmatus]TCT10612.1 HAMP domain-containing protein [Tepidamorphus gemmatus]
MTSPALDRNRRPPGRSWTLGLEHLFRSWPIRRRILALAVVNSAIVVVFGLLVWDGGRVIGGAWSELEAAKHTDRQLIVIETQTGRLQTLIHRHFNQPRPTVLAEIEQGRAALLGALDAAAMADPALASPADDLKRAIDSFLGGFEELRDVRTAITTIYEQEVLTPASEMAGLYSIIDSSTRTGGPPIWPALAKSREALSAMLVAANAYYLSLAPDAAADARRNVESIERTVPVMLDLAETDLQRQVLTTLMDRAATVSRGLRRLEDSFATQARLLQDVIDGNQARMERAIADMLQIASRREAAAQTRFDEALSGVYRRMIAVTVVFIGLIVLFSLAIARSLVVPLYDLMIAMREIAAGNYDHRLGDFVGDDEIGDMAIAIEVFRENAIARRRAEEEVIRAKERAENALAELRHTQRNLIDAEKLAALGGLVAGVAHEVNNPVGISLTVASTLQRRVDAFAAELATGQLRRSQLSDFVAGVGDAATQLVANLHRAGDLIQSFKQVAVDRSQTERRTVDLREATEQILASLRPGLKKLPVTVETDIPDGIPLDSYPGPYGQVVTNLFLNAMIHAFPDGAAGRIAIAARRSGADMVEICFSDDGCGMEPDVAARAFDPFFTTRRGSGGTGLGLHIVYNLVTQRLGGRIVLASEPGRGTCFRITLPLVAPNEDSPATHGTA